MRWLPPLAVSGPLFTGALSLAVFAVAARNDAASELASVIEGRRDSAAAIMEMVAGEIETAWRQGNPTFTRDCLVRMSSDPDLRVSALIDEHGIVRFASVFTLVGARVEDSPLAEIADRIRSPSRALPIESLTSDDGRHLFSLHTVPLRGGLGDGHPPGIGWLVAKHDLSRVRAEADLELRQRAWYVGAPFLVMSVFFAAGVQVLVTRRMNRLLDQARAIAAGTRRLVPISGRDEFARISAALASMAHALGQREEQTRLLTAELDHRVKNALATVLALAQQVARRAANKEELLEGLTGRVTSMARMHEALAAAHWESLQVHDVIRHTVLSQVPSDLVALEGPAVAVDADVATPLALAFHELATNATKYGAFSAPGGKVSVTWTPVADGLLSIRWRESRGAPMAPPGPPGTGTRILRGLIEHELGGSVVLDFSAGALACTLTVPTSQQRAQPTAEGG